MTPEQIDAAKIWFIERFLPTPTSRSFAMKNNELVAAAPIQAKVRRGNARYDFGFIERGSYLVVAPRVSEASWTFGAIYPSGNSFRYACFSEDDIKNIEDEVKEVLGS